MKRLKKLIVIWIIACLMFPHHSEAKTLPKGKNVKVVNKVYPSSPSYVYQQFYSPSNTHTFYQKTWSAHYENPAGIVTEPTAVVPKGKQITVSFNMLAHLVFKNYNFGPPIGIGTLNTAFATVRFVQFDRYEEFNGGALFTPYDYLLIQKTDIGIPQRFGKMNFKTAKTITKTFIALETGKYSLFFELRDLTRNAEDVESNGYNAYYGIQNV